MCREVRLVKLFVYLEADVPSCEVVSEDRDGSRPVRAKLLAVRPAVARPIVPLDDRHVLAFPLEGYVRLRRRHHHLLTVRRKIYRMWLKKFFVELANFNTSARR